MEYIYHRLNIRTKLEKFMYEELKAMIDRIPNFENHYLIKDIWRETYEYYISDGGTQNRVYSMYMANDFTKKYALHHNLFINDEVFTKPTLVGKLRYKDKGKIKNVSDLFYYIGKQEILDEGYLSLYNDVVYGTTVAESSIKDKKTLQDVVLNLK